MGVFNVFEISQMVLNRAKHLICFQILRSCVLTKILGPALLLLGIVYEIQGLMGISPRHSGFYKIL